MSISTCEPGATVRPSANAAAFFRFAAPVFSTVQWPLTPPCTPSSATKLPSPVSFTFALPCSAERKVVVWPFVSSVNVFFVVSRESPHVSNIAYW